MKKIVRRPCGNCAESHAMIYLCSRSYPDLVSMFIRHISPDCIHSENLASSSNVSIPAKGKTGYRNDPSGAYLPWNYRPVKGGHPLVKISAHKTIRPMVPSKVSMSRMMKPGPQQIPDALQDSQFRVRKLEIPAHLLFSLQCILLWNPPRFRIPGAPMLPGFRKSDARRPTH